MALPVQQQNAHPASPGLSPYAAAQRDGLAARRLHPSKDARRPRRQSLRRVKDSREELRRSRARGTSNATIETSASSTTTAGRSFTVANINNGIIYLRPVVRAGNQRSRPQPDPFVLPPQTPPDSATLDSSAGRPASDDWEHSLYSPRTPTRNGTSSLPLQATQPDHGVKQPRPAYFTSPSQRSAHFRSRSFSTVDEHTVASQSTEPGTFKVVIERPSQSHGRPKTADTTTLPILEVPIPHYRLGTPRISNRGTVTLRSSVYTTRASDTEEIRSSLLTPQRAPHSFLSSRPRSDIYSPVPPNIRATMDRLPRQPTTAPTSARVSKDPIGPRLYDALTANPDDHAVVRFSPSGDIVAATPSRLVAHITSPSFLDYELLSDFFLTFRAFLSSRDLVAYLLARLRWAVDRQDDFGRIVRVRTFVALRHWILNYFVDDFVPVYPLRTYFCELANSLYCDLQAREDGGGGDIKIVGELKKCWRRTCALYWESDDCIGKDLADAELLPGGQVESQASFEEPVPDTPVPSTPPRQTSRAPKAETVGSNPSDQFASRHMDWAQKARHTPQNSVSLPHIPSQDYEGAQVPLSPASEQTNDMPLYPHPVPHPVPTGPARFATSPQQTASTKKSSRPSHAHKRSGSFSDALRDHRAPLSIPKNAPPDATVSIVSNVPGSLVRGGIFQPGSPYIDAKNGGLRHTRSHLDLDTGDVSPSDVHMKSGHATNPGMKKLFGSVRRALSSKQPGNSSLHLPSPMQQSQFAPSTRSSNPTTVSNSGGVHKRRQARPRPQVRVDVLASMVSDSFKVAVKEQLKTEHLQKAPPDLGGFEFEFEKDQASAFEEAPAPQEEKEEKQTEAEPESRIYSNITNITSGSKSIVIVDDTGPPPLPVMSGAIPNAKIIRNENSNARPQLHQRGASIDQRLEEGIETNTQHSEMYTESERDDTTDIRRSSRDSVRSPTNPHRRSISEGRAQLHSFRRHGSAKAPMARSMSLRKHASVNSGLNRAQAGSVATFQTMSSDNDPFFLERQQASPVAAGHARQLRRRPGGDLRAADNVQDLENMQRPHSTGSVSNRTHSIANSVAPRSDRFAEPASEPASRIEPPEAVLKKKPISLVDTHSSQPNLRPSFEAEVAKLAALPDDIDDDGGIESALMKLEGRYEKKSPEPSPAINAEQEDSHTNEHVGSSNPSYIPSEPDSSGTKSYGRTDDVFYRPLAPPEAEGQGMYRLSGENFNRRVAPVNSTVESDDSYSSIPLLDRGLSEITTSPRSRTLDMMRSSAKPAPLNPTSYPTSPHEQTTPKMTSGNSSIEYVVETNSMKRIPKDGTLPRPSAQRESFLLDEDQELSDLDSVAGARSDDTSHGVRSFFDDEPVTTEPEKDGLPTHPMRHPPTPPLTANRLNDQLPRVDTTVFERGLPTPGLTPTSRLNNQPFGHTSQSNEPAIELQELKKESSPSPPSHLPFVLAYDSELLAQQFTIVEKDALDEIDWKELIELKWKQSSPQIRDWVQYLRTQEARGVDVVIARFNLVVKWAVSECVLTENIEERARCIVKYIHIAAHARRLRNYVTMYQLTIALLSSDVSRLRKTWALVPAAEQQVHRELETLVQPLRNFHNLRVEMETSTVEDGCIPFIGIYTRDLIYNANKPTFIDAPPVDGERLVNFERHHTAAGIVKNLLRLLEASSKYTFKAEPNIISKCLWMAALSDEEITRLSRQLE